jgi:predicted component of type VI protein secretion system
VIFVEQKPRAGEEHPVADGMVIGREGCDLNLIDAEVSRRHAALRAADGALAIEDLGSTNGTFVNEQRIRAATVLSDGDSVRLGGTVWTVRADAPATMATVAPRGDVPAPPEVTPSAIRRVLPAPAAGQAPQFSPPGARPGGSAATRVEATIVCMAIIAAVAIALIVYFATY